MFNYLLRVKRNAKRKKDLHLKTTLFLYGFTNLEYIMQGFAWYVNERNIQGKHFLDKHLACRGVAKRKLRKATTQKAGETLALR